MLAIFLTLGNAIAADAQPEPDIILVVSDDTGRGDMGFYGSDKGRGMPAPKPDVIQAGCFPNRSGMTTVAFQGQGGGLSNAEWTLVSVLKKPVTTHNSRTNGILESRIMHDLLPMATTLCATPFCMVSLERLHLRHGWLAQDYGPGAARIIQVSDHGTSARQGR